MVQHHSHNLAVDLQDMFRFISERSENIISAFSPEGLFTYVSPSVYALLGYTPEEVVGKPATDFNHPDDNRKLFAYRKALAPEQPMDRFIGRVLHKNGEYRWYETTAQYIRDESGAIIQTICVGRDITHRIEAEKRVEHLAYHDTLTDLPNRRLFQERVDLVLEKYADQVHGLMLLDLDGFKDVNDTYGHDVGDLLLISIARRLLTVVGDQNILARLGGDEFTVFGTNIDNNGAWADLIKRVEEAIAEPILVDGNRLCITASIGSACYPTDGDSVRMLMKQADLAMYRAKHERTTRFGTI